MANNQSANKTHEKISAQPRLHQRGAEIQAYGTVNHLLPLELEENTYGQARRKSCAGYWWK